MKQDKKQPSKNDWFIMDNYIHMSFKQNSQLLFYNPLTGKILEYNRLDSPCVMTLARRLKSSANLMAIPLTQKELENPDIAGFVQDMRDNFMGDLVDRELVPKKPIQLMPMIKVHKDADEIKKLPHASVGTEMMKYPVEISLYIDGHCDLDCTMCSSAFKQLQCCTKFPGPSKRLPIETITRIFHQLKSAPLSRINILGGDIFNYPQLIDLTAFLNSNFPNPDICLYSHYFNCLNRPDVMKQLPIGAISFHLIVPLPVNIEIWRKVLHLLRPQFPYITFHFLISDESHLNDFDSLVTGFQIENYQLHPFFDGQNLEFFKNNIFLDKDDLQEARPNLNETLARQLINTFGFGRLTVLNNGNIYANVNEPRLGDIRKDSIYQAVYKEMRHGRSWRKTRVKVAPCKQCTFQFLCPPISNYEYALGFNNLCHIW